MANYNSQRNMTATQYALSIGCGANPDRSGWFSYNDLYQKTGIRRFRTGTTNSSTPIDLINAQGSSGSIPGYGMIFNPNVYHQASAPLWSSGTQQAWIRSIAPYIAYMENPNEMDNTQVGGGTYDVNSTDFAVTPFSSTKYNAWCQQIFNLVHDSSEFASGPYITGKSTPIIAPSFGGGQEQAAGTSGQQFYDFGNLHTYPSQMPWNHTLVQPNGADYGGVTHAYSILKNNVCPNRMVIGTEIGHNTGIGDTADPVSETTQAKMLLSAWHGFLSFGSPLMVVYTGQDDPGATYNNTGNFNDQAYYGLVRSEGIVKVSGRAIKNMLTLCGEYNPSWAGPLGYPTISVTGVNTPANATDGEINPTTGIVVIAKSDGSFWVVTWNEPKLINMSTSTGQVGGDIQPANNFVGMTFGGSYSWTIYDPLRPLIYWNGTDQSQNTLAGVATQSSTAIASGGPSTALPPNTLNLLGYPMIVKLVPDPSGGGGPPPVITTHGLVVNSTNKLMLIDGKLCYT